jgi:2-methylcitrate dehydratase PrpD
MSATASFEPSTATDITETLARYSSGALARPLPAFVAERARLHVLDTLAAMISGTRLDAGRAAIRFASSLGTGPASVPGTMLSLLPSDAALVNGMTAHADETDDTHAESLTHPGSVVVPAALAAAEHVAASGSAFVRAVALGYDVCCRMGRALGSYEFFKRGFDTHAFGGIFGAAAAAGALFRFDTRQMRHCFSYAAQQASGCARWVRDSAHIEKAFDFAGMPAQNGVRAAQMVAAGLSGVDDVFDGEPNFVRTFNPEGDPATLVRGLGRAFDISITSIKKWCVATPAQAPLDGLYKIMHEQRLPSEAIAEVQAEISVLGARVVTGRDMPNVDVAHLLAVMLVDRTLTFAASHDVARMADAAVRAAATRVRILPSKDIEQRAREAIVTVTTTDGRRFSEHVRDVRGTPRNAMDVHEVCAKARDLIEPVLGEARSTELIQTILSIDVLGDVRAIGVLTRL